MIGRLGIVARLGLILLLALATVQIGLTAVYVWRRDRTADGALFSPLADQVAAMVELADKAGGDQRDVLLRSWNTSELTVTIAAVQPAVEGGRALPRIEARLRAGLPAIQPPRPIAVRLYAGRDRSRLIGRLADNRLVAAMGLADGRFLVAETEGELLPRLFGLQPGFFAGLFGVLVALIALAFFSWEARPLRRLARAVKAFADDPEPRPVKVGGAAEVRVAIRAFNDMQARLSGMMRNRAFVLGAMAHDLRTYLTRLRLRAEMLPGDAERAGWTRNLDQMSRMVEDSLAFARASFGADRQARTDLADLAAHEVAEREAGGAAVAADLPAGPLTVRGDAVALARALANVVGNALKYAGSVELSLRREGGMACLAVADRGPGIPPDLRAHLGEPFHLSDLARNRDGGAGAGLGLAIATQVVTSLGGRITFDDRPGGGTIVTLALPVVDQRQE